VRQERLRRGGKIHIYYVGKRRGQGESRSSRGTQREQILNKRKRNVWVIPKENPASRPGAQQEEKKTIRCQGKKEEKIWAKQGEGQKGSKGDTDGTVVQGGAVEESHQRRTEDKRTTATSEKWK